MIVPEDQVEFNNGHFTKTIRRYEAKNWSVEEKKPKEEHNEESQIHPQTGKPVWSVHIRIYEAIRFVYAIPNFPGNC